jgi:hypothetical protein
LIIIVAAIEFFLRRFVKIQAIAGYTILQVINISYYDNLLYEIMEKRRGDLGLDLPPEINLLCLLVGQMVALVILNKIIAYLGGGYDAIQIISTIMTEGKAKGGILSSLAGMAMNFFSGDKSDVSKLKPFMQLFSGLNDAAKNKQNTPTADGGMKGPKFDPSRRPTMQ